MSVLDRPALVPVNLGFCPCEGEPHPDGDVVYLYPELSVPAAVKARAVFVDGFTGAMTSDEVEQRIAELWLSMCVAEWTFVADDGSPIPVTPENVVRALPYGKGGREVADKADDLYVESVTAPLLTRLSSISPTGQTNGSTSPTRKRTTKRRARS